MGILRRPLSTPLILSLFLGTTLTAIITQTWWTIAEDRRLVLEAEKLNGRITARLLEEHATQTLEGATRKLDEVAESIQRARIDPAQPDAVRRILASHDLFGNPNLKALQFVGLDGRSWITSPDYPAHQTNISDRRYYQILAAHPEIHRAMIGRPYASRYDSQLALPVARNLFDRDGHRIGLISVDIRLAYFGSLYARLAAENNASVAIFSEDGFIIVRSPFEARYVDRDIDSEPGFANVLAGTDEGSFEDAAFLDDEFPRLYTYRKVRGFPVATVYGRDLDSILAPWQQRTAERLRFSAAFIILVVALTWFLQRYIRSLQGSRQSLRESEARFVRLFQLSPVPLILIRGQTREILEVNEAWSQQYGFPAAEAVGRTVDELGIWVDPSARERCIKTLTATGKLERQEVQLRHRDGKTLICLLSGRIFDVAGEAQVIFNSYDITRIHEIETEIRQLNAELEARVQNRTQRLANANAELSAALSSVQEMQKELVRSEKLAGLGVLVAGVAHELNTPIGNGLMVASAMQEQTQQFGQDVGSKSLSRAALVRYVTEMEQGSTILVRTMQRAAELISSFKQVAVDQTSDVRRSFDLARVLDELAKTLEASYRKSAYRLELEIPVGMTMDSYPGALGQVISNLVNNSIVHGFEGKTSGIMRITATLIASDSIEIVYSDDGIGIPPEHLEKVFDPFFTSKLGMGGSGLGMHIVYNIVSQMLGGTISLQSEPGAGVLIRIRLPISAPFQKPTTVR